MWSNLVSQDALGKVSVMLSPMFESNISRSQRITVESDQTKNINNDRPTIPKCYGLGQI